MTAWASMFIEVQPSRDGASSAALYFGDEAARAAEAARQKRKTTRAARLMKGSVGAPPIKVNRPPMKKRAIEPEAPRPFLEEAVSGQRQLALRLAAAVEYLVRGDANRLAADMF